MQPRTGPRRPRQISASPVAAATACRPRRRSLRSCSAAGAPVEVGVAEVARPACRRSGPRSSRWSSSTALSHARSRQRASPGFRSPPTAPVARVALAQQPLHHRHHARGVRALRRRPRAAAPSARAASAIAACAHLAALPWAPRGRRGPARTCSRKSAGVRALGRLGVGAPDVDARVVVGAADADRRRAWPM